MIEVTVAMLLVTLMVAGLGGLFITGNHSSLASQRQINLLEVAQAQIEQVRQTVKQYGFSTLALNAYPADPTHSPLPSSPSDPNDFLVNNGTSSASYLIEQNYNSTSHGQISIAPANGEPLEVDTTNGRIAPKTTSVAAGSDTATVWTYVTKATVGCVSSLGACAADDARRVIVAARLKTIGNGRQDLGPNKPVYLTTIISNPVPSNQPNNAIGLRLGLNIG
jgi:type II secretory pathway pseudopilin PulG